MDEKPKSHLQPQMSGRIEFVLPLHKKTSYVRAAHASGQKLVPWIVQALDKAAKPQETPPQP